MKITIGQEGGILGISSQIVINEGAATIKENGKLRKLGKIDKDLWEKTQSIAQTLLTHKISIKAHKEPLTSDTLTTTVSLKDGKTEKILTMDCLDENGLVSSLINEVMVLAS